MHYLLKLNWLLFFKGRNRQKWSNNHKICNKTICFLSIYYLFFKIFFLLHKNIFIISDGHSVYPFKISTYVWRWFWEIIETLILIAFALIQCKIIWNTKNIYKKNSLRTKKWSNRKQLLKICSKLTNLLNTKTEKQTCLQIFCNSNNELINIFSGIDYKCSNIQLNWENTALWIFRHEKIEKYYVKWNFIITQFQI